MQLHYSQTPVGAIAPSLTQPLQNGCLQILPRLVCQRLLAFWSRDEHFARFVNKLTGKKKDKLYSSFGIITELLTDLTCLTFEKVTQAAEKKPQAA